MMKSTLRTVWTIIGFEACFVCVYLGFGAYGIRLSYTQQRLKRDIEHLKEESVVLTKVKHDLTNRTGAYAYATDVLGMRKSFAPEVRSLDSGGG